MSALACATLVLGLAASAAAATVTPSPAASVQPASTASSGVTPRPSAGSLRATDGSSGLPALTAAPFAQARAKLLALADQANQALQEVVEANTALAAHEATAAKAHTRLTQAQARSAAARLDLDRYANAAFRSQLGAGSMGSVLVALGSKDPSELLSTLSLLDQVTVQKSAVLTDLLGAERAEAAAVKAADDATAAVKADHARSVAAKAAADAAVKAQLAALMKLQAQWSGSSAVTAGVPMLWWAPVGPTAKDPMPPCAGGDITGATNGALPTAALCPLWQSPGQLLAAPAAAAFNLMSVEYAAAFGTPICVGSSYRTFAQQAALHGSKPGMAAPAGRSNHGWGRAADLCGGIDKDGTPQNTWLRMNAARFGWFHPAWADEGGSGAYEPWHWEFAG